MNVLIIGGVAAGTKAAAKIKRLLPDAQVTILTKGRDISYAGCGLPYYVGGLIEQKEELIVNTGDIVEITYTATAPTVEQVAGNLNSSGYASYSGACYVFADGVTNLTAGSNRKLERG